MLLAVTTSTALEVVSNLGVTKDAGLRWTVFSDFGSVWATDLPSGVTKPDEKHANALSFGILWNTVIGPLSFYWANPSRSKPRPHKNLPILDWHETVRKDVVFFLRCFHFCLDHVSRLGTNYNRNSTIISVNEVQRMSYRS